MIFETTEGAFSFGYTFQICQLQVLGIESNSPSEVFRLCATFAFLPGAIELSPI